MRGVWLLLAFLAGCSESADPWADIRDRFAWHNLPVLDASRYEQQSSYDRLKHLDYPIVDPGNKDFTNFLAVCGDRPEISMQESDDLPGCEPGMRGYLIAMDDRGPGMVTRMWMTTTDFFSGEHYQDEVIKIYVDDLSQPIYQGSLIDWQSGQSPVFQPPLAGYWSGGLVSYIPILYNQKLRILIDNLETSKPYYHHIDLRTGDVDEPFPEVGIGNGLADALMGTVNKAGPDRGDPVVLVDERVAVAAGAESEVVSHQGAGAIQRVRLTFDEISREDLSMITLRLFWDDLSAPAVDVSLADFFGCRQAIKAYDTLPMRIASSAARWRLECFLPMPFAESARLVLGNTAGSGIEVDVLVEMMEELPEGDWGHLHVAMNHKVGPFQEGDRHLLLDQSGTGKYIGTLLYAAGRADPETAAPDTFNYLEGDEQAVVDGEIRIPGTGTEDYFNGAWYFADGLHNSPFSALVHIADDGEQLTGEATMLRWHVLTDAISFQESLVLDMEYGADKPDTALDYTSLSFFYLRAD